MSEAGDQQNTQEGKDEELPLTGKRYERECIVEGEAKRALNLVFCTISGRQDERGEREGL